MDKLAISGIKLTTLIGIHDWEQQCPQNLYLDITLQIDAQKAALEDNIQDALDYDRLVTHIFTFVENTHFHLIETLAERLAQEVLHHFPTDWVQITLHKPGALQKAKDVTITVERSR